MGRWPSRIEKDTERSPLPRSVKYRINGTMGTSPPHRVENGTIGEVATSLSRRLSLPSFLVLKRLSLGVLVYIYIPQSDPVLTEIHHPLLLVHPTNIRKCLRTQRPFSAVFRVLRRLHLSVLAHISISWNGPILTEIHPTPPPGTSNKTHKCLRTQRSFSAVFRALRRLYLSVLAHIFTLWNRPILTSS